MPRQVPQPVWIHRIVHERNLPNIFRHGMLARPPDLDRVDEEYVFIGHSRLTDERHTYPVPIKGYGNLGDYVPFYFGPRSPMLYNIYTGYGVQKRPQDEIVYLSCKVDDIVNAGLQYVFTDGHAKIKATEFFTSSDKLCEIDWEVVKSKSWYNTIDEPDRQRKKQAEFLVLREVKPELISAIVVFNQEKAIFVKDLLQQAGLEKPVYVNPKDKFYY